MSNLLEHVILRYARSRFTPTPTAMFIAGSMAASGADMEHVQSAFWHLVGTGALHVDEHHRVSVGLDNRPSHDEGNITTKSHDEHERAPEC